VFSVPSRFAEPRGVAVLEAMGAGLPVIVPNSGVYPELLAMGGGGNLVESGDGRGLARIIDEMMGDRVRLAQMGKQAREMIVQHCSSTEMVEKTLGVYEQLTGKS